MRSVVSIFMLIMSGMVYAGSFQNYSDYIEAKHAYRMCNSPVFSGGRCEGTAPAYVPCSNQFSGGEDCDTSRAEAIDGSCAVYDPAKGLLHVHGAAIIGSGEVDYARFKLVNDVFILEQLF